VFFSDHDDLRAGLEALKELKTYLPSDVEIYSPNYMNVEDRDGKLFVRTRS